MKKAMAALILAAQCGAVAADLLDTSSTTPDEIRSAGQEIRKTLYWEKKDLKNYVTLARHLLATAQRGMEAGGELTRGYGARVLGISFDIASFTWPGWDEDGVEITDDLRRMGLDAARLNVQFCENHQVPEQVKSRAYFILGAHLVSDQKHEEAIDTWRRGIKYSDEITAKGLEGWIVMAEALKSGEDADLTSTLEQLESAGEELAQTASQIRRAYAVFHGA